MRIAIRFGDNDFYHTLYPFMKFLLQSIREYPNLEHILTKKHIVQLFNNMAPSIYLLCQDNFSGSFVRDGYLKIDETRVYFTEEIDIQIKENNFNWDCFYIDTDNNQINCW